jgi:hypothetical protein
VNEFGGGVRRIPPPSFLAITQPLLLNIKTLSQGGGVNGQDGDKFLSWKSFLQGSSGNA